MSCTQTNTYQAVVISDGKETYSIYTYNCDRLMWSGKVSNYASIGFNVLGDSEALRLFENRGLSQTPIVGMAACNHTEFNRPWSNVVYRVGVSVSAEQLRRSVCLARVARDEEFYEIPDFVDNAVLSGFGLSDCPCSYFQTIRDRRFFYGGGTCFFNRFVVPISGVSLYYGKRCCYDPNNLYVAKWGVGRRGGLGRREVKKSSYHLAVH